MIIFMAIQSTKFDYAGLLVVNWALLSLGVIVIFISIAAVIGIQVTSTKILVLVWFMAIVCAAMLIVFGIGAITFNNNLLQWVDQHWEVLRDKVETKTMTEFKYHVSSELTSLGAFSFTIIVSISVMITALTHLIGT